MKKSNDAVKTLGILLTGILAGVTLGILFAPDKGSETRNKLANRVRGLKGFSRNKMNNMNNLIVKEKETFSEEI